MKIMMNLALINLTTMDVVLHMMDYAFRMMNYAFKMMNFVLRIMLLAQTCNSCTAV